VLNTVFIILRHMNLKAVVLLFLLHYSLLCFDACFDLTFVVMSLRVLG
jgi:hypothetical protein